jgi:type I restriction enzyme S subunit
VSTLPSGWIIVPLGYFAFVKNGYAFKSKDYVEPSDSTVPVIRISDIQNEIVKTVAASHVIAENAQDDFLVGHGDFLIAMSGATTGKTGIYSETNVAYQNQRVGNIKLRVPGLGSDSYKNYLIRYLGEKILEKSYGAAQPNISGKLIEALAVPIAPYSEQNRIVNKLDSILAKVDKAQMHLEKIPIILKRFRQSVLAAAISGELTREWREENPVSEWKALTLGDVAKVQTGNTPLKSNSAYYEGGDIPWLTSTVTGQTVVSEADKYVTRTAVDKCRLKIFPSGTLLIAMYGEGKTRGQVTEIAIEATINQACAAVNIEDQGVSKEFIKLCIENNYEKTRLMAEGGAQPNLNLSKVRSIPVVIPSLVEQKEIIRRVEELFSNADIVLRAFEGANSRVKRLTQSVLAKAFRGELAPQDPSDESASILLDRIKKVGKQFDKMKIASKKPKKNTAAIKSKHSEAKEDDSRVFSIIKSAKGEINAQQIMDELSDDLFTTVDLLFSELKRLLDNAAIVKRGDGELAAFRILSK